MSPPRDLASGLGSGQPISTNPQTSKGGEPAGASAEGTGLLGESARRMLESWDEAAAKVAAADPRTSKEILDYWLSPENMRPSLLPILAHNPSVTAPQLYQLAERLSGELREVVLGSCRMRESRKSSEILGTTQASVTQQSSPSTQAFAVNGAQEADSSPQDSEADQALIAFSTEHAGEIASQEEKPFQPIGGMRELVPAEIPSQAVTIATAAGTGRAAAAAPAKHPMQKKTANSEEERRGSVLQKIARLDVKGRIQLAIKGTKEERSILIRDGTKIVALAVLDSPKITDSEVEKFATQKNVLEAVLRAIPLKRRFVKNYATVRNLAFNPRTPIDVSLTLVKNLLLSDLRNLSGNKEVSDTVRKLAYRLFKQKQEASQNQ